MLKVGITGGIGSGKTTVCKVFEQLGIPVFYADIEARRLMETDVELIAGITALLGAESYRDGKLNRPFIASVVFKNPDLLQQMNALTHPAVIAHGKRWMREQQSVYVLKEAALFFESGSYSEMDWMIGVAAPLELRISRTMKRDGISREAVLERMSRQMEEKEKLHRCDFIIHNNETDAVIPQVLSVHRALLSRAPSL